MIKWFYNRARHNIEWSENEFLFQFSVDNDESQLLGLDFDLQGLATFNLNMNMKAILVNIFQGEGSMAIREHMLDFNYNVLIIPYNREIDSKFTF